MPASTLARVSQREFDTGSVPHRSSSWRLALGTGIALFVVTRLCLLFFFSASATDLPIYFTYAVQGVDIGQTAYEDFPVEYPPLAYWVIAAPRFLRAEPVSAARLVARADLDRPFRNYVFKYRSLMMMADVLSFILVLKIGSLLKGSSTAGMAWGYVAVTTPLAHVLYDRLDMGLLLLLLIWVYGRLRSLSAGPLSGWNILSFVALGLSIPYKLVGVVALPFVIFAELRGPAKLGDKLRTTSLLLGICLLAAGLPFAVQWSWSGSATLSFLKYHAARGIEIESTYGSALLLLSRCGLPIETEVSYGSANLVTPLSSGLTAASPLVLLAALGLLACSVYRIRDQPRVAGCEAGLLAILLLLVCSKVLSAQYFVFALPLLLVLTFQLWPRWAWFMVPALMFLAVLTTVVFPFLWFPVHIGSGLPNPYCLVPDLHFLPCALLGLRNLLFVALVLGFWREVARSRPGHQPC